MKLSFFPVGSVQSHLKADRTDAGASETPGNSAGSASSLPAIPRDATRIPCDATKHIGRLRPWALVICLLFNGGLAWGEDAPPRYFAANPGALAESKARLAANDNSLQPALKALLVGADDALENRPPSVMDKKKVPPSGDLHDYISIGPYWWPDPKQPDGLPYIRRDGKTNPESRAGNYDLKRMGMMTKSVESLALAYYFTGKEAYATGAVKYLHVWFLDADTRMNPNLEFAQAVLGQNTGRGIGVIEGRSLARVADAAGLLARSEAWTPSDLTTLKKWMEEYLNWLLTSKNGRDEAAELNNHGTWYDVQAVELALVLGKTDIARQICETAKTRRIAAQIQPDGSQPLELERTAAFGYSCFNLDALFLLANLSEYVDVDLWDCRLPNGQHARRAALDFILPYAMDADKKWPYQQIKRWDRSAVMSELRQAAIKYKVPEYEKALESFPHHAERRFQLLRPAAQYPALKTN